MLSFEATDVPYDHDKLAQERREAETVLEQIMDRYTWDGFIDMLQTICHEKASHVAEQNPRDAAVKNWGETARAFERVRKFQPYGV